MRALRGAMRLCGAAWAAASLLAGSPAKGRPFTMDDMMALRHLTGAYLAPDGRRAVVGLTQPYDRAGTFGDNRRTALALNRLYRLDLGAAVPTLARIGNVKTGLSAGPFSPSGARMVVFGLHRRRLELGVVDLSSGTLHWSGQAGRLASVGQSAVWLSEHQLLFLSPLPGSDLTAPADSHRRRLDLWTQTALGRRPAAVFFNSGRFAQVAPPATSTLRALDTATGAVSVLARGRFDDLEPSPSHRFVALGDSAEDAPLGEHPILGFSDVLPRRRLLIFDRAADRLLRPCPDCDLSQTLMTWAPRSDRLLVFVRRPSDVEWSEGRLEIWSPGGLNPLDLGGVVPTIGTLGSEALARPAAAWRSERPLVFAHRPGQTRSDWFEIDRAGPSVVTASLTHPEPRLDRVSDDAIVTSDGGRPVRIDLSGTATPISSSGTAIAAADPGEGLRRSLQPRQRPERVTPLRVNTPRPGWTRILASDQAALVKSLDAHSVTRLAVQMGARLIPLVTLNGHLESIDVPQPLRLTRATPQGEVTDWLYLPPHGATRPPLVVVPYPGYRYDAPPWMARLDGSTYTVSVQRLVAQGFAALVPSLPAIATDGEPAQVIADALVDAIETDRRAPSVDGERIAVMGHSYGGYTALLAATRCPGLAAVVAAAAPADLISERGVFPALSRLSGHATALQEMGLGWSEGGQGALLTTPQRNAARYIRNSPLFAADRVRSPTLLIYGDEDLVGLGQGEEMFSALKRADRDVRLMVFIGEDHTLTSPANLRSEDREVEGFLREALRRPPTPGPVCVPPQA